MGKYDEINRRLAAIPIVLICQHEGIPVRNSGKNNNIPYPFSPSGTTEKGPSFHINARTNTFFDHGASHSNEVKDINEKVFGKSVPGGDAILFMTLVLAKRHGLKYRDMPVSEVMKAVTAYATGLYPDIASLITEEEPQVKNHSLKDVNLHSGGAKGADYMFGKEIEQNGGTVYHYYHPNKKSPYGNVAIPEEDIRQGAVEAAAAAKRMYGYKYPSMKDENIIRDYSQVKNADTIIAVANLVPAGTKFNQKNAADDRVCAVDTVVGGTGYAVNMAIIHGKPVYVFNQTANEKYPVDWYIYNPSVGSYVPCECPTLTKNFAGIGSRELKPAGEAAIRECVTRTKVALSAARSETPRQENEAWRKDIDTSTKRNIWASSRENVEFSNMYPHPLSYRGLPFISCEQLFQYLKCTYFGDEETAKKILQFSTAFKDLKAPMSEEDIKRAMSASYECKKLGRQAKVSESVLATWDGGVNRKVLSYSIHLTLLCNPDFVEALDKTGNCLLTHEQGSEWTRTAFPEILMRERAAFRQTAGYRESSKHPVVTAYTKGVTDPALVKYLKGRCIPDYDIQNTLFQVEYTWTNDEEPDKRSDKHTAIGTPSIDEEGALQWDIRGLDGRDENGEVIKRHYSTGQGCSVVGRDGQYATAPGFKSSSAVVTVFEGKMELPSYLALQGKTTPETFDSVILNSTVNKEKGVAVCRDYPVVILALNNDLAGQNCTEDMARALLLEGCTVFDARPCFIDKGSPMLRYELRPAYVVGEGDGKRTVLTEKYDAAVDGPVQESLQVTAINEKYGYTLVSDYWKERIGKGPNDINDALQLELKRNPKIDLSGPGKTQQAKGQHHPR